MSTRLRLSLVLSLLGASTVTGCQTAPPQPAVGHYAPAGPVGDAPAEPPAVQGRRADGGLLLQTGSIQLGPGVGRNAWRWQGDGEGGF